ncbi:hypothetical protein [Streptomyces meridianus]|uniref:MarR family transcriptional regulator n=1 Tax=Streptomyces meridianus TaxID=2938945 RepID=A0ABT0X511_9ACTN|nr:hypothetical protein [Streptomyces meridianus]MCM2577629.1 hypothetical protein [Streptomyces meridianus]
MAAAQLSSAPLPYAPPMASPGYGKRSVLGQPPCRAGDFAHLPTREASVAAHIDRLPEGAAIDAKTLARELPAYGQQAVRSALTVLSEAGHLRRVRENAGVGCTRWVFRTYFSRVSHDDLWWARFLSGEVTDVAGPLPPTPVPAPDVHPEPRPAAAARARGGPSPATVMSPAPATSPGPTPRPVTRRPRSEAYDVLASLGRTDPRMTLSAVECAGLEELAGRWLERGATAPQLVLALTAGLPQQVHSPAALARSRLTAKLPPEPLAATAVLLPQRLMECTDCGTPGSPEALPGGLCRICRGGPEGREPDGIGAEEVRARVALLRAIRREGYERSRT